MNCGRNSAVRWAGEPDSVVRSQVRAGEAAARAVGRRKGDESRQEFGKVAVLLGGRAGLGGAQHRCGQAKRPPVHR